MRIRIFQAFASNNSGSYTIVGSFETVAAAQQVAEVLATVCAEHAAWFDATPEQRAEQSPLEAFARLHRLSEAHPGCEDDWPEHGPPPSVCAIGAQVLIHVPYTITMPRAFGEFFYQRGGRVNLEYDHAHQPLVASFVFYVRGAGWQNPEAMRRVANFESALREVAPTLVSTDRRSGAPIAPAFHAGEADHRMLSIVFDDLVAGVDVVRKLAVLHGVDTHLSLHEWPDDVVDPLSHLRPGTTPRGTSRVILWSVGGDQARVLKALRDVMGSGLEEAQAALTTLPTEILLDVAHPYAEAAAAKLREGGCDAEAVVPSRKR